MGLRWSVTGSMFRPMMDFCRVTLVLSGLGWFFWSVTEISELERLRLDVAPRPLNGVAGLCDLQPQTHLSHSFRNAN